MKKANVNRTVLISLLALTSELCIAQNSLDEVKQAQRWVNGSWVNVRVSPSGSSEVITKLFVNTPVQLINPTAQDEFCEIAWGENMHGYMACSLLGSQPLSIEEVGVRQIDIGKRNLVPNQKYSATRAFWIEPSFTRLQDAGDYFEQAALTPEQRKLETVNEGGASGSLPAIQRFPVPEFEAMKALMNNGVVASANYARHPKPIPALLSKLKEDAKAKDPNSMQPYSAMLQQIELQMVSGSHFKTLNEIGRPSAITEELSHVFQIAYSIRILSGPSWKYAHYNGLQLYGSWDMGDVDISLTKQIFKNTVSARGVMRSQLTSATREFRFDDEEGGNCRTGFQYGGDSSESAPSGLSGAGQSNSDATNQLGKHRKTKRTENILSENKQQSPDVPLFYFFTKEPFAFKDAKMTKTGVQKLQTDAVRKAGSQKYEIFQYGSTKYFDVDLDGVYDFAVWEGMRPPGGDVDPENDNAEPNFRLIFANVGGQWYLLDTDDYIYMCGC